MDVIERWGDDIDSAVNLALVELKATIDEVDVEVLEQPSKGFFGIGSKLAHVKVTRKEKPVEKPVAAEEVKTPEVKNVITKDTLEEAAAKAPKMEKKESGEKQKRRDTNQGQDRRDRSNRNQKRPKEERKDDASLNIEAIAAAPEGADMDVFDFRKTMGNLPIVEEHPAITFLTDVLDKMGLKLNLVCRADETNVLVDISGEDTRTIIGKRGQTLDAIQYLTSLVVNKNAKDYVKVVIDAENYRSRRQKTLEQLADRLARKAVKTKHSVRLEPMNPYERKVIHATLQGRPHIVTRSEGQDPYRRVVIEYKK